MYLFLKIIFIPLLLILLKVKHDQIIKPEFSTYEGRSIFPLFLGILLLTIGVMGCFVGIPSGSEAGKIAVHTRYININGQSADSTGGTLLVLIFAYLGGLVLSWAGALAIWQSAKGLLASPANSPWEKKGDDQWRYESDNMATAVNLNPIADALVIDKIDLKESTFTARQLHEFLWQCRVKFPRYEIWLLRSPAFDALIFDLGELGLIRFNKIQEDQSKYAYICWVSEPEKYKVFQR